MRGIIRGIGILFIVVAVIAFIGAIICFKALDTTPYAQCGFYKKELVAIENAKALQQSENIVNDTIQVGWSRVNLQPPFTTTIAIDAHRGGKHFTGVHDSIYVRAFVFKQGDKKIAYVSADLLIIPPTVTHLFDSILVKDGFDTKNIFFTATHTHESIGGWYPTYVGEIFAGKYDERVPAFIANCIAKAITGAEKNCSPAKVGFKQCPTSKLVFNRLVNEKGKVDSMLRIVKIEKESGEKASIITFAAHCTVFHEHMMQLSADWAGPMMKQLNESGKMQFACFSAGEVGSHGPYEYTKNQEEEASYMANNVAKAVADNYDSITTHYVTSMSMVHLPLFLREPNLRISSSIVVRPWLFNRLFGDEQAYINTFRIGDIFFAGTPCDFSGELTGPIDSAAGSKNMKLIITSFNGGYIGYITDSKWYGLDAYETRTMGWFGPGNGDYLSDVIIKMME